MGRCAVLVVGPAGSGKSTFCNQLHQHTEALNRRIHVVNLDPAAEQFAYPVSSDIRELISLEDVMSECRLGPNGGLVYAMEYLVDNFDWLEDELEEMGGEDSYVVFDCPGQIELYSHLPVMRTLVDNLQRIRFRVCCVYLLDSQFIADTSKFVAGVLCCLSAMTALELPHVSVISKCDLLPSREVLDDFLEADSSLLADRLREGTRPQFYKLNNAICQLIEEWNMVQFLPLNPDDDESESLDLILQQIDNAIQYHDDVEPRTTDFEEADNEGPRTTDFEEADNEGS